MNPPPPLKKHICIDFEGVGRPRGGTMPLSTLLGALVPNRSGRGKKYRVWLLEDVLAPMTRPRLPGAREVCAFREAIAAVVGLAEERNCRLVAYSCFEEDMVKTHLAPTDRLRHRFRDRVLNIKLLANKLVKRRRKTTPDRSLEAMMQALAPGHRSPPPPRCGAAEACRRLRAAGVRSNRWRNWTETQRQLAKALLDYNKGDCEAVWRLVNRVKANLPAN